MLCWICPECGRESPPAVRDCPACLGATAAASVPESLQQQLEMTAGILALARTFQEEPSVRLLASAPRQMLLAQANASSSPEHAASNVQTAVAEPAVADSMETVVRSLVESAGPGSPRGLDPGPIPGRTNGFHPEPDSDVSAEIAQEPDLPLATIAAEPDALDVTDSAADGRRSTPIRQGEPVAAIGVDRRPSAANNAAGLDASVEEPAVADVPAAAVAEQSEPVASVPVDAAQPDARVGELAVAHLTPAAEPKELELTAPVPADAAELDANVAELAIAEVTSAAEAEQSGLAASVPVDAAELDAAPVEPVVAEVGSDLLPAVEPNPNVRELAVADLPLTQEPEPSEPIAPVLADTAELTAAGAEPAVADVEPIADPTELNASVVELASRVAELQASDVATNDAVLADPGDLEASIEALATNLAEVHATEPPPPVEWEPELIALANALEFHAILQLEAIDRQVETDDNCIRAILESFFEQPKNALLCWPASIVQPPAPPTFQRIPTPRPNIAPAGPPPAAPIASSLAPQPLTLAGPYLPRELQGFVPSPPRAAKGSRQNGGFPGWVVSLVVAILLFLGAGTMLQYFTGNRDAKASSVSAAGNGADASLAFSPTDNHPLARFVEVTGLRVVADLKHRSQLHYIVVNHGPTQLAGVALRIAVRSSVTGSNDPPLFAVSTVINSLGAYQSKEFKTDLEGDVRSSVIPEWQNLRADFQVGAHQ